MSSWDLVWFALVFALFGPWVAFWVLLVISVISLFWNYDKGKERFYSANTIDFRLAQFRQDVERRFTQIESHIIKKGEDVGEWDYLISNND